MDDWKNKLYYGDNLDIMREYIEDDSVDLIYLDPPFNSKATYNVLFKEKNGSDSTAQITAFDDTWHWDIHSERSYNELVTECPISKLSDLIQALRSFLGTNDMMAYLTMMAIRLVEMHRVLKSTGSIYLHCDPTASHYLKMVMDSIYNMNNFRNEIIWKRKSGRGESNLKSNRFGQHYDILLFYSKTDANLFNTIYSLEIAEDYIKERFRYVDEKKRIYMRSPLNSPSFRENLCYEYKGYKSPPKGWAVSLGVMKKMDKDGRLYFPPDKNQRIYRKIFLDEYRGQPIQSIWSDIPFINPMAKERLGYPTQKPEALLKRIIKTSSNEGDIVLDPFCGCGTTVSVAEKLNRKWIGIDITHLAISLMKHRLESAYGGELSPYEIIGDPKDLSSANALSDQDKYQFEWWALSLIGARPAQDKKKGADSGIDGVMYFFDDESGQAKKIVVQVKGGHVTRNQIATLKADAEREKASIGVFITLNDPTKPMIKEAAEAGFYEAPDGTQYPKLQIFTISELLDGKEIDYPRYKFDITHKKAQRKSKQKIDEQAELGI